MHLTTRLYNCCSLNDLMSSSYTGVKKLKPPVCIHVVVSCGQTLDIMDNIIKNSQAVKKGAAPKKAMVKKDVKSKVAAKKWL